VANVKPFAPGYCEVKLQQTYGGATNIWNRMFFRFSGTMGVADALSIAQTATTKWTQYMAPLLNAHLNLIATSCTDLGSASGATNTDLTGGVGTVPITGFLPAKDCMVSHGYITRRYRGGKPRWYQSGFTQADLLDNQHWTSTALSNWETAITEWATDMGKYGSATVNMTGNYNLSFVNGYSWVPYTTSSGKENYRKDPVYRDSVQPDIISNWVTSPVVASQRKRGVN